VECPRIVYTDLDTSFCKDIGEGHGKAASTRRCLRRRQGHHRRSLALQTAPQHPPSVSLLVMQEGELAEAPGRRSRIEGGRCLKSLQQVHVEPIPRVAGRKPLSCSPNSGAAGIHLTPSPAAHQPRCIRGSGGLRAPP
jgi:hypothetical protein